MTTCRSISDNTSGPMSAPLSLFLVVDYSDGDYCDQIVAAFNCHQCHEQVAIEDVLIVQTAVANLDRLQRCEGQVGDEVIDEAAKNVRTHLGPAVICCPECSRKFQPSVVHPFSNLKWFSSSASKGDKS